jgi:hypothetical protein
MPQARSIKQNLINKANSTIVVVTASACFVVVFSIVASVQLIGQLSYQNRVISAKKEALNTLKEDIKATESLTTSYNAFINTTQNAIGGDPNGTGPQDGNNEKIVLDALPSSYDFPALATSLENILVSQGQAIQGISGVDDSINQANSQTSPNPEAQPMPFELSVKGNYDGMRNVIVALERSIRPIKVKTITMNGDKSEITMTVNAETYFQPQKSLKITTKVIE